MSGRPGKEPQQEAGQRPESKEPSRAPYMPTTAAPTTAAPALDACALRGFGLGGASFIPFHSCVGMDHVPNPYRSITACLMRREGGSVWPVAGDPLLGTSLLRAEAGGPLVPAARPGRLTVGL